VESQKVIEKSGKKSKKLLLSSLKVEKAKKNVGKPSIFSGKRWETFYLFRKTFGNLLSFQENVWKLEVLRFQTND
jgi:hypothetical protein